MSRFFERFLPPVVCVVVATLAVPVAADVLPDSTYHRALPCRPTIACTADIGVPGTLELEAGAALRALPAGTSQITTPFLLKLTVASWLQFQLDSNAWTFATGGSPANYFDNVVTGLKVHALDQGPIAPMLSFSAAVSFPTWSGQEGYARAWDIFFVAYVTKDVGWLHADLNLGLNLWNVDGFVGAQPWVALALSGDIGRGFGAMLEGYFYADAPPLGPMDGGMLSAATFSPAPWFTFDAGVDVGLVTTTRRVTAFLGVTSVLFDLWDTSSERVRRRRLAR